MLRSPPRPANPGPRLVQGPRLVSRAAFMAQQSLAPAGRDDRLPAGPTAASASAKRAGRRQLIGVARSGLYRMFLDAEPGIRCAAECSLRVLRSVSGLLLMSAHFRAADFSEKFRPWRQPSPLPMSASGMNPPLSPPSSLMGSIPPMGEAALMIKRPHSDLLLAEHPHRLQYRRREGAKSNVEC